MTVCLCRGVPDRTIRAAIAGGASTVDDIHRVCGAGGDCGACHSTLAELVDEGRQPAVSGVTTSRCVAA